MATVIPIDLKRRQTVLFIAATLAVLPAGYGAEMEIYVTTGPDGVEIFSNLPRGPVEQAGLATKKGKAASALPMQPTTARWQVTEASNVPESAGSEAAEAGKSFLLDD